MSAGFRYLLRGNNGIRSKFLVHSSRDISVSSVSLLKQIVKVEEGDKIRIEGKYIPSPREKYLAKELAVKSRLSVTSSANDPCSCSLCNLDLQIKHTDVLILSQFTNSKGKLLPRKVTGLCKEQDKRVDYLLVMAEKAGLIDTYTDTGLRMLTGWEKFNKYYDESAIEDFIHGRRRKH